MNAVPTSPPLDNLQKLPQKLDILTHWNWFEYFCDDADRFHWKYLHDYFVDEDVDLWWCWWHWLRMHLAGIELRSGWFDIKFNCTYPFTANIVGFLFSVIIIMYSTNVNVYIRIKRHEMYVVASCECSFLILIIPSFLVIMQKEKMTKNM